MKKLGVLLSIVLLLVLVSGCVAPAPYVGASVGVYGEYPATSYGYYSSPVYPSYPAYTYYPHYGYRWAPYDRDHYWDRGRHWDGRRYREERHGHHD
jgi:hypothetical protein